MKTSIKDRAALATLALLSTVALTGEAIAAEQVKTQESDGSSSGAKRNAELASHILYFKVTKSILPPVISDQFALRATGFKN